MIKMTQQKAERLNKNLAKVRELNDKAMKELQQGNFERSATIFNIAAALAADTPNIIKNK